MKPDARQEAERWLRQAANDLASAQYLLVGGFYPQACLTAQQVAEKALKALAYLQGERAVLGHSASDLIEGLGDAFPPLKTHRQLAGMLDQYYVSSRYPNALPGKAPFEVYTRNQAREAVQGTAAIVQDVESILGRGGPGWWIDRPLPRPRRHTPRRTPLFKKWISHPSLKCGA